MGNAYRLRGLLLLAALGAMTACARSTNSVPYASSNPDPPGIGQSHALAVDWDRMARLADGSAGQTVANPVAGEHAVRAAAAPPPEPPRLARSSVADAATEAPAPARNLWDKQPWEVELDNAVRGICRGC
jgi:hypothetical protein